jgi:hypothetical protein
VRVEVSYLPPGFVVGALLSTLCAGLAIALSLLRSASLNFGGDRF